VRWNWFLENYPSPLLSALRYIHTNINVRSEFK